MSLIESLVEFDKQLLLVLNSLHTPFFDEVMWIFSAKFTWIPLYLTVLFFLFKRYRWQGAVLLVLLILTITAADQISVRLFKNVFERLRPCHEPDIMNMVHSVHNYCGGQFGFVSSHAANTAAFAVFTMLVFKQKMYTIGIIIWAIVVSYSRIYLGVHYPGDILGGFLLGIFCGWLFFRIFKVYLHYKTRKSNLQS